MACEICDAQTNDGEEICEDCHADERAAMSYSEGEYYPDAALNQALFMGYC